MDAAATARAIVAGDVRLGARAMRMLDDRSPGGVALLRALYPHTGRAHIVGVTGNPGAGKSTLVSAMVARLRALGRRVGVLAIDPSSPFSGGALLGDRVRMMAHAGDSGVFIRSVATRGALGGLSRSTGDMACVLDAMGHDVVLVETVGVGQDEVDVMRLAHTTVVVMAPGLGDDIQAIKAGILEIADVFVVNKADRDGAERTVADLRAMQGLRGRRPSWLAPVLATVATREEGAVGLVQAIDDHRRHQQQSDEDDTTRQRAALALTALVRDACGAGAARWLAQAPAAQALIAAVASRAVDPYTAAEEVARQALGIQRLSW